MNEKHHVNLPSLAPRNFEDALKFSEMLAQSSFVPTAFKGKAGDILAAIQMGYEVGLSPMAALQNIAVINGRPCMWGDALLAVVQASGLLEFIDEQDDGTTATCTVKRKGDSVPRVAKWSVQDTQRAGLANKDNHKLYPARMRQHRARGFALRDKFADVLKGLITREEAIDVTPVPDNPGELTEAETPKINDAADADRLKEAEAEGPALGTAGETPVPDGDVPTVSQVKSAFILSPLAPSDKFRRIEAIEPNFQKIGGIDGLNAWQRKKVMEALKA